MKRFLGTLVVAAVAFGFAGAAQADEKEAKAILDKGIKALGGEEKLGKVKAATWKNKSTISFGENENEFKGQSTVQGLDHYRVEFTGEVNGNEFKGVIVLDGDKGWRKFGEMTMEMDGDGIEREKRTVYLQVVPMLLLPLREKGFKYESAGESKVDGKPALGLKATGPDGKEFTLYFDKESGLPVKQVADVVGFNNEEFTQETTFADYREFDGIKKATKIESKRDGNRFMVLEITEFKVLDKADADTFSEPK